MISKIIQKEKERQEGHLRIEQGRVTLFQWNANKYELLSHKQSLINLKEYMEEEYIFLTDGNDVSILQNWIIQKVKIIQEDIKELTKMIEAYKWKKIGNTI